MTNDERPSIAEMRRLAIEDSDEEIDSYGHICARCNESFQIPAGLESTTVCDSCAQHVTAVVLPVLLEIAAAALAYSRPVEAKQGALDKETARRALEAALEKVRP